MAKKDKEKSIELETKKIKKYTGLRNSDEIKKAFEEINQVMNITSSGNKDVFNVTVTKNQEKPKRKLIDDVEKGLSDVSDEKLEAIALDILTEVIKRNDGKSGVNAVDLLRELKQKKEPKQKLPKQEINSSFDKIDMLIMQNESNNPLLDLIDERLEKTQNYLLISHEAKKSHHIKRANDIGGAKNNPKEAKKVLNTVIKQHKKENKSVLTFNILTFSRSLHMEAEEVRGLFFELARKDLLDVEIIDETVITNFYTPQIIEAEKAKLLFEEEQKRKVISMTMVTDKVLPEF